MVHFPLLKLMIHLVRSMCSESDCKTEYMNDGLTLFHCPDVQTGSLLTRRIYCNYAADNRWVADCHALERICDDKNSAGGLTGVTEKLHLA